MNTITTQLADALRAMPDDFSMIEHNPDEGMRLFCCGGDIIHNWHGDDIVKHAADCWYIAAREALAAYDAARNASAAPAGAHTPEPWHVFEIKYPGSTRIHGWQVRGEAHGILCVNARYGEHSGAPIGGEMEANARRIVACVNACAGVPTADLERGVVARAIGVCKFVWDAYGDDLVNDEPINGGDAVDLLCQIGDDVADVSRGAA